MFEDKWIFCQNYFVFVVVGRQFENSLKSYSCQNSSGIYWWYAANTVETFKHGLSKLSKFQKIVLDCIEIFPQKYIFSISILKIYFRLRFFNLEIIREKHLILDKIQMFRSKHAWCLFETCWWDTRPRNGAHPDWKCQCYEHFGCPNDMCISRYNFSQFWQKRKEIRNKGN